MPTYNVFRNQWIAKNKYGKKYIAKPELIPNESIRNLWIEDLQNRALTSVLTNDEIYSFIEEFGEKILLFTFRGIYANGIKGYIPNDNELAHKLNPTNF